ncbi:hypothetical protein F511_40482 [Dorcoceras hygrometricum]|uniref:Uncharacterized protein n=1 Tax=Dorcoceras hygrometricum TaxID=472368 RepID=A0A2Z7BUN3_9LAMI|nr:hypothetical protein F511_40482 [Dorcoceras hygrometricum]
MHNSRPTLLLLCTNDARYCAKAGRRFSHDAAPVGHTLAGTKGDADCANVERWCAACRAHVSEEAGRWLANAAISRRSWHSLADMMVLAAAHVGRWLRAGRAMRARCDAVALRRRVKFFVGGGRRPATASAPLRRCRDGWSDFF